MKRKALAILMTACLVLTMIPVTAIAADPQKEWGDPYGNSSDNSGFTGAEAMVIAWETTKEVYFHDIDKALDFVNENGGTIFPYLSASVDDEIVFDKKKRVYIDLSKCDEKTFKIEKDITVKKGTYCYLKNGTLKIDSKANEDSELEYGRTIKVAGSFYVTDTATVVAGTNPAFEVENLLFTNANLNIDGTLRAKDTAIVAKTNASIEIGHDISKHDPEVISDGDTILLKSNAELIVNFGKIKSNKGMAVTLSGIGSMMSIYHGDIEGEVNAVKVLAGRLDVNATSEWEKPISFKSNTGDAIVIHAGASHPTIQGKDDRPTVISKEGEAVTVYGTFLEGFISSGIYSSDVNGYVAKGYVAKKISDRWVVCQKSSDSEEYNAKVIGNYFVYLGCQIRPLVYVTKGGEYVSPFDYTVKYDNNIEPGDATVEIYVDGNDEAVATATFTIDKCLPLFQNSFKNTDTLLSNNSPTLQLKDASSEQKDAALTDSDSDNSVIDDIFEKYIHPHNVKVYEMLDKAGVLQKLDESVVVDKLVDVFIKVVKLWNELKTEISGTN